ncbi:hypothetical protein HY643_04045 [Candidatus Woesearchaeota archaeon]|nr:hypothetical protein [Candidatus Woesearchaeota archaeon]
MKKGQVTIFIILGVLIIVVIGLIAFYKGQAGRKAEEEARILTQLPPEFRDIGASLLSCSEVVGGDSILTVGSQGGYYDLSKIPSIEYYGYRNIPYLYFRGKSNVPSKEKVEKELANYVEANLNECARDFEGFSLTFAEAEVTTTLKESEVRFKVKWPVIIKKGDLESTMPETTLIVNGKLEVLRQAAESLVNLQQGDKSNVCISCAMDLAAEKKFVINAENYDNDFIYTLQDNSTTINGQPLEFAYAHKF